VPIPPRPFCELLTRFPGDQLYIAGAQYWTGVDLPPTTSNGIASGAAQLVR
jgi:hypothetical protein